MKFRFSLKTTLICLILASLMIRASVWQWGRHKEKQIYINEMHQRLEVPVTDLNVALDGTAHNWEKLIFRRLNIAGNYDFTHEMLLRNRRHEDQPGFFVLTPMKLTGREDYLLVSRGFIPLTHADQAQRKNFQKTEQAQFIGLVKEGSRKKFLAPSDPETGAPNPWVDQWLRVDLEKMTKQLPYKLLPVYVEIMALEDPAETQKKILDSKSGRDEMFFMPAQAANMNAAQKTAPVELPVPVYDTVTPPDIHFGYVFEWAVMALITISIGVVLQLRRKKQNA